MVRRPHMPHEVAIIMFRRVEAPALWEYLAPRIEREPEFLARKTEESLKIPVAADGSVA